MDEPNKSIFKKFLIIYAIILTVLMLIFLGYVADSLIQYEKNQTEQGSVHLCPIVYFRV